jgi:hypothetical protein
MTDLSSSQSPADARSHVRVYAAELDATMCPACAVQAGVEYANDDPNAPAIPNPNCSNPRGCRCQWL